jgi:hypothetical protein
MSFDVATPETFSRPLDQTDKNRGIPQTADVLSILRFDIMPTSNASPPAPALGLSFAFGGGRATRNAAVRSFPLVERQMR